MKFILASMAILILSSCDDSKESKAPLAKTNIKLIDSRPANANTYALEIYEYTDHANGERFLITVSGRGGIAITKADAPAPVPSVGSTSTK